MKHIILFAIGLSAVISLPAQQIHRTVLDSADELTGYFLHVPPVSGQVDGVLLLLPGFAQQPESIFTESKLPYVASANKLLTVAMAGGRTLFADDEVIDRIDNMIHAVQALYPNARLTPWAIGGFSAGGTLALRYAERCGKTPDACPSRFGAVFEVDAPVDLLGLWTYFDRELDRQESQAGLNEARFVKRLMQEDLGSPEENPQGYAALNPFDASAPPGNARWLAEVAVRAYHDVDIPWLIEERGRSAFDGNFLYASEMIVQLRQLGNDSAEFIQTDRQGMRSDGTRHPHSWSIVDEAECVQWIKRHCAN